MCSPGQWESRVLISDDSEASGQYPCRGGVGGASETRLLAAYRHLKHAGLYPSNIVFAYDGQLPGRERKRDRLPFPGLQADPLESLDAIIESVSDVAMKIPASAQVILASVETAPRGPKAAWLTPPKAAVISTFSPPWIITIKISRTLANA